MKQVHVSIKGKTPLLMHRFPLEPVVAIEKKAPEEQAEISAYRDDKGRLCIPALALQRAIISGATYSKGKGRGSLQKSAAACIFVSPDMVPVNPNSYTVDARAVVVPATKGRIVRYRPKFDIWECAFTIEFDEDLISEPQLNRILIDTGDRVGLLDFRPEKKGPFGRFMVTEFKKA